MRPKVGNQDLTAQYTQQERDNSLQSGMRFYDAELHTAMWNNVFHIHLKEYQHCKFPQMKIAKEVKKGICWKVTLACENCTFSSMQYKLYREVPKSGPGPKAAVPNYALQVGLQDTTMGNTKARLVLAATGTPPPARSTMQETANKVGQATVNLNNEDMAKCRKDTKRINQLRGLPATSPVNIQMDARYNSYTIGSRQKFGQNASQAIGVICEDQTDQHKIIGLYMQNKLCWTGAWLRGRGFNVKCPGGHSQCTANTKQPEPLSEYELGKVLGVQFGLEGINIDNVTTDGDGRGAEGIQAAMRKIVDPVLKVNRMADPIHLAQGQFRACLKATFSSNMFPGKTKADKNEAQKVFSLDMKTRCSIVFNNLYAKHNGDTDKMGKKMPKTIETIMMCYSGDCSHCRYQAVACSGGKLKSWWVKSYIV